MIAKGNAHAHGAKLGAYLVTGKDGEKARLHELRGFAEDNVVDAFRSVHIIAGATKCEQPFFHCQVRNPAGEHLNREQWEKAADRIEHKLGLIDQPRAIAFHEKDGQEHMHVAWSRIDTETMTAKPLPFYKLRLKEACRELEKELDLTRVRNQREAHEPRAASRAEFEEARRKGADLNDVRASIRQAWEHSDTGRAFAAALKERGFALAQGDRRDYVVIDQEGSLHALGKRLLGVSAAETRARMSDLDRNAFPSVATARGHQTAARVIAMPGPAGSPPNLVIRSGERTPTPERSLHTPEYTRTITHATPKPDEREKAPDAPGQIDAERGAGPRRETAERLAAEQAQKEREIEAIRRQIADDWARENDLDRGR